MKIGALLTAFTLAASVAVAAAAQNGNGNGNGNGQARGRQNARAQAAERERMRFRAMDTDNDGVITRDEWRGNVQSFNEHDTNHDGVLSGAEVRVPAEPGDQAQDRTRREERLARFTRADRDADGRISFREWNGSEAMFDRMDQNHDNFVTRDEFMEVAFERPAAASGSQAAADARQANTAAYKAGYQKGIEEGRQAGREDKGVNGGTWDLEGQRELEQADSGYRNELGMRTDYQAGYRAGFRIGYREGFGPRR